MRNALDKLAKRRKVLEGVDQFDVDQGAKTGKNPRRNGSIFGTVTVALIGGGAAGPWLAGVIHDATGSYRPAFLLAIGACIVSALAIWIAAPRKVRRVPGRARGSSLERASDAID